MSKLQALPSVVLTLAACLGLGGALQAQSVAGLPFADGFESGSLGPAWGVTTQGYGQVQVTQSNGPASGSWHVTLGTSQDGFTAHASLILSLALEGLADVDLSFAHKEFDDEPDPEDGVWLSSDGVHYFKALSLDAGTQSWSTYSLDLDAEAAQLGLQLTTPFFVRFRWKDNFKIPADGFAFDDVLVTAPDCNQNGVADALDIAGGTSLDCNLNGLPDECDLLTGASLDLDGDGNLDDCVTPPLYALEHYASIVSGGSQDLAIDLGPQHAGELYLLLGSLSGTQPGTPAGGLVLPLNLDAYLLLTLANPNSPGLVNSFGSLSATGTGLASVVIPPGLGVSTLGLTAHHAALALDGSLNVTAVTNPVPLTMVQ